MASYRVVAEGVVRETYVVEADSEDQALATYLSDGTLEVQETISIEEVISVTLDTVTSIPSKMDEVRDAGDGTEVEYL